MFREINEMIDSTVYKNGRGEVTAQDINLAMHGIVDAVEYNIDRVEDKVDNIVFDTAGSGSLRVWINTLYPKSEEVIIVDEEEEENLDPDSTGDGASELESSEWNIEGGSDEGENPEEGGNIDEGDTIEPSTEPIENIEGGEIEKTEEEGIEEEETEEGPLVHTLTRDQVKENKATYTKLIGGSLLPVLLVASINDNGNMLNTVFTTTNVRVTGWEALEWVNLYYMETDGLRRLALYADGTVEPLDLVPNY